MGWNDIYNWLFASLDDLIDCEYGCSQMEQETSKNNGGINYEKENHMEQH